MFLNNFAENISIYYDNLSWYLLITIFVTSACALLTLCLQFQIPVIEVIEKLFPFLFANPVSTKSQTDNVNIQDDDKEDTLPALVDMKKNLETDSNDDVLSLSNLNSVKRKSIFKDIHTNMTPEQKAEEEEAVNEQLAKIFNLLKEQEDKFKMGDIGDLKEQLSLYRS